jgi:hypothetical protein
MSKAAGEVLVKLPYRHRGRADFISETANRPASSRVRESGLVNGAR